MNVLISSYPCRYLLFSFLFFFIMPNSSSNKVDIAKPILCRKNGQISMKTTLPQATQLVCGKPTLRPASWDSGAVGCRP
ncbi:unnamed protein product [Nyctereutes procyonoides]|uniref:(raccoon dog) hypothetical protein n=1 Tax=Nyctereutes procyonoides TaxID=34880 RepID=A0A811ZRG5_NYCPR|nr:unnamed protein product [Nyctereutes procyonoides]